MVDTRRTGLERSKFSKDTTTTRVRNRVMAMVAVSVRPTRVGMDNTSMDKEGRKKNQSQVHIPHAKMMQTIKNLGEIMVHEPLPLRRPKLHGTIPSGTKELAQFNSFSAGGSKTLKRAARWGEPAHTQVKFLQRYVKCPSM